MPLLEMVFTRYNLEGTVSVVSHNGLNNLGLKKIQQEMINSQMVRLVFSDVNNCNFSELYFNINCFFYTVNTPESSRKMMYK